LSGQIQCFQQVSDFRQAIIKYSIKGITQTAASPRTRQKFTRQSGG
jgi:hypothetical protein